MILFISEEPHPLYFFILSSSFFFLVLASDIQRQWGVWSVKIMAVMHSLLFLLYLSTYFIISVSPLFMLFLRADQTWGYLAILQQLEIMFVSVLAFVFSAVGSQAKALMSGLRYVGLIHGSHFSFSFSRLFTVSGTTRCICALQRTQQH